ncbi:MAG: sn-glycerol-3-phosphate ABC transporter ATP-binding protein UgpC [Rhizobacter sp.]|nr:sn-glycerol-3-phosphate ABC transporter ATP-binding protein UgpC [Rhizobacter sp.]
MASVTLRGIRKSYGEVETIRGVDLQVKHGEFMVFVGPSGCGKSTLMRMVAGLEEVTQGELLIGDRVANDIPAPKRGVAMVFQSYALYPHMTVAQNMGFSLKMHGMPADEIHKEVARAADILQIGHLLDRTPKALSGGQRQRVAIGRAIVRRPEVFLFDEPLSNLDANLRVQMRVELTKLHKQLGSTMIYVTHDQTEAMTMGDRIAVFNGGLVEQVGQPMNLYEHPANRFVAQFLGSPRMNLLTGALTPQGDGCALRVTGLNELNIVAPPGVDVSRCTEIGVRPEAFELATPAQPAWSLGVDFVERLGDTTLLYLLVPNAQQPLCVRVPPGQLSHDVGSRVRLRPVAGGIHLFDRNGVCLGRT